MDPSYEQIRAMPREEAIALITADGTLCRFDAERILEVLHGGDVRELNAAGEDVTPIPREPNRFADGPEGAERFYELTPRDPDEPRPDDPTIRTPADEPGGYHEMPDDRDRDPPPLEASP